MEICGGGDEEPGFPFWAAARRRFKADDPFFAAGNIERELLAKQVALDLTEDERDQFQNVIDADIQIGNQKRAKPQFLASPVLLPVTPFAIAEKYSENGWERSENYVQMLESFMGADPNQTAAPLRQTMRENRGCGNVPKQALSCCI